MGSDGLVPDGETLLLAFAKLDRLYQIVFIVSVFAGLLLLVTARAEDNNLFLLLGLAWLIGGPLWVAGVSRYGS